MVIEPEYLAFCFGDSTPQPLILWRSVSQDPLGTQVVHSTPVDFCPKKSAKIWFLDSDIYTPGSTNMAVAGKMGAPDGVDVFPFYKTGIFQPAMLVYQRVTSAIDFVWFYWLPRSWLLSDGLLEDGQGGLGLDDMPQPQGPPKAKLGGNLVQQTVELV